MLRVQRPFPDLPSCYAGVRSSPAFALPGLMSSAFPGAGVVSMARVDGYYDGFATIQGIRAYDPQLGSWTTPDAYQGEVHDPMSLKSYVWNRNNPVGYADPAGFESFFQMNGEMQEWMELQDSESGQLYFERDGGAIGPSVTILNASQVQFVEAMVASHIDFGYANGNEAALAASLMYGGTPAQPGPHNGDERGTRIYQQTSGALGVIGYLLYGF